MPFASINPPNPRTNLRKKFKNWRFWKTAILKNGDFEKRRFWKLAILNFFRQKNIYFLLDSHEILTFFLVSRKFLAMRNIMLYSVTRCRTTDFYWESQWIFAQNKSISCITELQNFRYKTILLHVYHWFLNFSRLDDCLIWKFILFHSCKYVLLIERSHETI